MDPETGRFTSEDPAQDGGNWYIYSRNNPIILFDKNGHEAQPFQIGYFGKMEYNDPSKVPFWAAPMVVIGNAVPLVVNTLATAGNGVIGTANFVLNAAQNPNWPGEVMEAQNKFVSEGVDYFKTHTPEQVLNDIKTGVISAAKDPKTYEQALALCLSVYGGVKLEEYLNQGPGLNGKTFDTEVADDMANAPDMKTQGNTGSTNTGTVSTDTGNGASNVNAGNALNSKLSALQTAQQNAAKVEVLPDGRIRYHSAEVPATKTGPTRGASYVTEWDPKTNTVRSWMESYNQTGDITRVHPKMIEGQSVDSQHYPPTASEVKQ
jgi:hypothetical protein